MESEPVNEAITPRREPAPGTGPPRRALTWEDAPTSALVRLAWPICVSMISFSTMTLVDTLFVGQLGTAALAGVGVGGVAAFSALCFPMGILRGLKVVVAQAVGAGQRERPLALLGAGLVLATLLGALSLAVLLVVAELLPLLMTGHGGAEAEAYVGVRAFGGPLFLWAVALRETRYGLRDSRTPMVAALVANLVNALLDAAFLFGLSLGVEGAALASVIAQGLEAAVLVVAQLRPMPMERGRGAMRRALARTVRGMSALRVTDVRAVLRIGVPTGIQMLVEVSAFAVMTFLLARRSELDAAAHQVALQVTHVAFLPALAVGDAAGVLAGEAIGAGRPRLVLPIALRALVAVTAYSVLSCVVLGLLGSEIAGAFADDAALQSEATALLYLATLFIVVDGAQVVARCVLRGTGDVRVPAMLAIACAWGATPPLTWLLGIELGFGARGAWIGLTVEIFLISALLWQRMLSRRWVGPARQSRRSLAHAPT